MGKWQSGGAFGRGGAPRRCVDWGGWGPDRPARVCRSGGVETSETTRHAARAPRRAGRPSTVHCAHASHAASRAVTASSQSKVEVRPPDGHPLPLRRHTEVVGGVVPERAVEWDEPVADRPVAEATPPVARRGRDDVARDALRERRRPAGVARRLEAVPPRPVRLHDVPVAEVRDAGAPRLADGRERGGVPGRVEERVDEVAHPLQRGAVVGRPQRHERGVEGRPPVPRLGRLAERAPRDEPAHAVADHDDAADRHRPRPHDRVEGVGQVAAGLRDVPAAVVADRQARGPQPGRERGARVDPAPPPLPVVHAEAVDLDQEDALRVGDGTGDRGGFEVQAPAVVADLERRGERVALGCERVPERPVERRHDRVVGGVAVGQAAPPDGRERRVERPPDVARHPADGAVRPPGDPPDPARAPQRTGHRRVDGLHDVGHARHGPRHQEDGAAEVGGRERTGHGA